MLTNQNTTRENLKKCSKKKRISKFISVLSLIILIVSIICVNANAVVIQEVSSTDTPYPTLLMNIDTNDDSARIEISGAGEESISNQITVNTRAGYVYYQKIYEQRSEDWDTYYDKWLSQYSINNGEINQLTRIKPININLWEWSQRYNDTIIWQLWDTTFTITDINALYRIEIPYFNNSAIMGTSPLTIQIEKTISGSLDSFEGRYYTYDLDLPSIEVIIQEAIRALESESENNITFQYRGEELENHNYVTNVYAEDGSTISIDFKQALSTILVQCDYFINGNVKSISILNYNDIMANEELEGQRYIDFGNYVLENEFERSAEITVIRKDKEVGLLNWLGNAIKGIMNVELFPNFSLGGLLSVIIMIPIILWILKLVAGG